MVIKLTPVTVGAPRSLAAAAIRRLVEEIDRKIAGNLVAGTRSVDMGPPKLMRAATMGKADDLKRAHGTIMAESVSQRVDPMTVPATGETALAPHTGPGAGITRLAGAPHYCWKT